METLQHEGDNTQAEKTLELLLPSSSVVYWWLYVIVMLELLGLDVTVTVTCGNMGSSAGGDNVNDTNTALR